jgi:quaternary ammonium compound-resistance protein SugE
VGLNDAATLLIAQTTPAFHLRFLKNVPGPSNGFLREQCGVWLRGWSLASVVLAWRYPASGAQSYQPFRPGMTTPARLSGNMFLLGWAVRTLPLGTAYTVWTGIGTVVLGIWPFNEQLTAVRLGCIALILAGIIGLKATSGAPEPKPAAEKIEART